MEWLSYAKANITQLLAYHPNFFARTLSGRGCRWVPFKHLLLQIQVR